MSKFNKSELFEYFSEKISGRHISFDEDFIGEDEDLYKDALRDLISPLFSGSKLPRITTKHSGQTVTISLKINDSKLSTVLTSDYFDPAFHDFVETIYASQSDEVLLRDVQDDWASYIVVPRELYDQLSFINSK